MDGDVDGTENGTRNRIKKEIGPSKFNYFCPSNHCKKYGKSCIILRVI
jgi:hypothetical protein